MFTAAVKIKVQYWYAAQVSDTTMFGNAVLPVKKLMLLYTGIVCIHHQCAYCH